MKNLDKTKIYNRKFVILGVALIVIFGLIIGYMSADLYNKYDQSKEIAKDKSLSNVTPASTTDIRLEENATIVYSRIYLKCNELNREQRVADQEAIGKNKSQLQDIFVGWNIVELKSDQLILEKSINSYSPQYFKIGTYDNADGEIMVAVYSFDIDGNEVLDNVTSTPIALLHESESEKLEEGIYVKDVNQLYEMLENYDE